jgi:hypothetical protein
MARSAQERDFMTNKAAELRAKADEIDRQLNEDGNQHPENRPHAGGFEAKNAGRPVGANTSADRNAASQQAQQAGQRQPDRAPARPNTNTDQPK